MLCWADGVTVTAWSSKRVLFVLFCCVWWHEFLFVPFVVALCCSRSLFHASLAGRGRASEREDVPVAFSYLATIRYVLVWYLEAERATKPLL